MAIVLDGSASVLRSTDFGAARPSAFSVSLACKVDSSADPTAVGLMANLGNSAGYPNDAGDLLMYFGHPNSSNRYRPAVHYSGIDYNQTSTGGSSTKGVWRICTTTYTAGALKYFEDGSQIGSTLSVTITASAPSDWYLTLGQRYGGSEKLKCMQAFIGYWDAELTAEEAAALGKGFSPRLIRPQSLKFFLPGLRDANAVVGAVGTATSLTFSDDNPRIYA